MLRRKFSHAAIKDVASYLRMSSDMQNPASPDQQKATIRMTMRSCSVDWNIINDYRDDGKSGRRIRTRPGFQQMLQDVKSGRIKVQAILVDTIERFGRMDELEEIRRELFRKYRVVILCADRRFADPNSADGRIASAFENVRAAEDSRIKAHNVLRGKYHAIGQKYWPGGPVPFGYSLEIVAVEKRGGREIKHHRLTPDPQTASIIDRLFVKSQDQPSWGQTRLSQWLNEQEDIPADLKPFHPDTIGRQLRNPIYRGELVWDQYGTGIVNDSRILERNDDEDVIRVPDFCEAIVDRDVWIAVQAGRHERSRGRTGSFTSSGPGAGVNYRYPLTGLLRCGHCGASMVPNSSSAYKTKKGEQKCYCSYACPNSRSGICSNNKRVKEEWLRATIVGMVRDRLFSRTDAGMAATDLLCQEVRKLVNQQRAAQKEAVDSITPGLDVERTKLNMKVQGWSETLAKRGLDGRVRVSIEEQYGAALTRMDEIDRLLEQRRADDDFVAEIISDERILERLDCLDDVLAGECANSANLELSLHIDRIDCYSDGRVISRTCKLGSVPTAVQWFQENLETLTAARGVDQVGGYKTTPRRRARMQIEEAFQSDDDLRTRIDRATDPNRFSGLPDDWFWIDEFQMPEPTFWAKENAAVVLARYEELQAATHKKPSLNKLSREFNVSRPTIANALDIAMNGRSDDSRPHRNESSVKVKGNAEMEQAIEKLHDAGVSNKEIAERLGIARSTVTNALDRIYARRGTPRPDGRKTRHAGK